MATKIVVSGLAVMMTVEDPFVHLLCAGAKPLCKDNRRLSTMASNRTTPNRFLIVHLVCIAVFLLSVLLARVSAFVPRFGAPRQRHTFLLDSSSFGDKELADSLRARQGELQNLEKGRLENWNTGKCESSISVALPDWVRRIDVDYPLIAAGSSSGTIFVAHAETGEILAQSETPEIRELDDLDSILRILYGPYDGGGTTAVAMDGDLIVSAGRQGSVQIHRYDKKSKILLSQGSIKALEGVLVTCIELDEDHAWIGTADGRVLAFAHSDALTPLSLQSVPVMSFKVSSSPILSLSLEPFIGYGVFTTARGSVELFSMEHDDRILASWYPPFDSGVTRQSRNTYPLAATIVSTQDGGYHIACGASDGSLYLHPLQWKNGDLDILHPLCGDAVECVPRHQGAVKCLTSPKPGLLISGGQDGAIRMWNVSEAICQYQFMGYKVWLGSLCTDGIRLISDGADNTIVVHDFEWQPQQSDGSTDKDSE